MFQIFLYVPKMRGFHALIMGAPGSGKGYVSDKIVQKYGAVHIATGDILRKHIHDGTPLGKEAFEMTSKGLLVPDHLLSDIIATAIEKAGNRNFVLDGYPRTLSQAEHLDCVTKLDMVINLDIPFDEIVRMLKNRLVHAPSGRVYNDGDKAPRVPGRDDVTGEPLERRADDEPSVVRKRLEAFEGQMRPVLKFYKKRKILHTFTAQKHRNMWPMVDKFLKTRSAKYPVRCFTSRCDFKLNRNVMQSVVNI